MSVFGDYRMEWVKRFSESELHSTWAEDVRANLTKHRNRITALKEELEKEECYVKYLEKLLLDAEKHSKSSVDIEEVKRIRSSKINDDEERPTTTVGHGGVDDGTKDADTVSSLLLLTSQSVSSTMMQCSKSQVDSGNFSLSRSSNNTFEEVVSDSLSASKMTEEESHQQSLQQQQQLPESLVNDESQFVTVIEVNGCDGGQDVRPSSKQQQQQEESDGNLRRSDVSCVGETNKVLGGSPKSSLASASPGAKKKVPPIPPPKRNKKLETLDSDRSTFVCDSVKLSSRGMEQQQQHQRQHLKTVSVTEIAKDGIELEEPDRVNLGERVGKELGMSLPKADLKPKPRKRLLNKDSSDSGGGGGCGSSFSSDQSLDERVDATDNSQIVCDTSSTIRPPSRNSAVLPLPVTGSEESPAKDLSADGDKVVDGLQYSTPCGLSDDDDVVLHQHLLQSVKSRSNSECCNDGERFSDYVNIQYFLKEHLSVKQQQQHYNNNNNNASVESTITDSDDDGIGVLMHSLSSDSEDSIGHNNVRAELSHSSVKTEGLRDAETVYEGDSGKFSFSESTSLLEKNNSSVVGASDESSSSSAHNLDTVKIIPMLNNYFLSVKQEDVKAAVVEEVLDPQTVAILKCVFASILESESTYIDCLNILLQYMKALRSTISTSQPVISRDDLNVIFHKIPELHEMHKTFLDGIRSGIQQWDGIPTVGNHFKVLSSRLTTYESFLQNYPRALETVRKCCAESDKFSKITKDIKVNSLKGQAVTIEDLLHKPVARIQRNALVIHDLLKHIPKSHPDHSALQVALRMTYCFLNEFNTTTTEGLFPVHDRMQRHLVKNGFVVELLEGRRKLRHLFLFSDIIVCAKYKSSGREKFMFEVKWYINLPDVIFPKVQPDDVIKENSPLNVLSLKSQVATVRDQIVQEEKQCKEKALSGGKHMDRHYKKLAELQAQLVLASPNLVFKIGQRSGRNVVFLLSSSFERLQWIEAISVIKSHAPTLLSSVSLYEIQSWIASSHKLLHTSMVSFFIRPGKDDSLIGDLHIILKSLQGLKKPAETYICLEVDSYGHFFEKGRTRVSNKSVDPVWNQELVIELEGSHFLRILCYEQLPHAEPVIRGHTTLELCKSWLTNHSQDKRITIQDFTLEMSLKYVKCEMSLRRVPSSKPCGVFGLKITHIVKKEKRPVPFLITCCVHEVEKRGLNEMGLYRVSGSASDIQKLRRAFESNAYEAEQLVKEMDIHSVTGLFKLYLRELPEGLFTDELYPKFLHAFGISNSEMKSSELQRLFELLPSVNKEIILYLIEHMMRINREEANNKMSLQNLATVFGPTLIRPGNKQGSSSASDRLASGTIDVMAQAGILYLYLKKRAAGESL